MSRRSSAHRQEPAPDFDAPRLDEDASREPLDRLFARLGTSSRGLGAQEAARRLAQIGANAFEPAVRRPLKRLAEQWSGSLSVTLWIAAALAAWIGMHDGSADMRRLAIALVAVVLVSGIFSSLQEHRAERRLAALQRLLPDSAEVLRDGVATTIAARELVPGDVLLLAPGARVPADGRLLEAHGLRVDNAAVTGEPLPQARVASGDGTGDALHARNVVLAGTSVLAGSGRALVVATAQRSRIGTTAAQTLAEDPTPSPLQARVAHLSRRIVTLAAALGAAVLAVAVLRGQSLHAAAILAVGVAVAMVPEGLQPTLTLSLVLAGQRMAARRALVRHLPAIEAVGAATVVCTDKTGTLTESRLVARECHVPGIGDIDCRALSALEDRDRQPLLAVAANCQTLQG